MKHPRIGNKNDICRELDVAPSTVNYWLLHGLPYVTKGERGKAYEFDLDEVKAWVEKRGVKTHSRLGGSKTGEYRERLMRAKAELAEMEAHEKAGRLVDAEEMEREIYSVVRDIRQAFAALPDRVAAELAAESDEITIVTRLRAEIGDVLSALRRLEAEKLAAAENESSPEPVGDEEAE